MDFDVNMSGLDELDKVLGLLPGNVEKKVLNKAVRKGSKVLMDEWKANAPVRTGEYRNAIRVQKAPRSTGVFWVGVERPHSNLTHLLEFGHARAPAHPFIRPAFDNKGQEALSVIVNELHDAVIKEAAKLAGRK